MPTFTARECAEIYGLGPAMGALPALHADIERMQREIDRAMFVPTKYFLPKYFGMDLAKPSTSNMETKMPLVEPKPLSHPVRLLMDALKSAVTNRDSHKRNAESQEQVAKGSRKYEADYDTKVVELTKALKKLGHKA